MLYSSRTAEQIRDSMHKINWVWKFTFSSSTHQRVWNLFESKLCPIDHYNLAGRWRETSRHWNWGQWLGTDCQESEDILIYGGIEPILGHQFDSTSKLLLSFVKLCIGMWQSTVIFVKIFQGLRKTQHSQGRLRNTFAMQQNYERRCKSWKNCLTYSPLRTNMPKCFLNRNLWPQAFSALPTWTSMTVRICLRVYAYPEVMQTIIIVRVLSCSL